MNYELALELKKSGFLQNVKGAFWVYLETRKYQDMKTRKWVNRKAHWKYIFSKDAEKMFKKNEWVYAPFLHNLIESCKGINILQAVYAKKNFKQPIGWQVCSVGRPMGKEYKTPEEAVANLWLELNKQKHEN